MRRRLVPALIGLLAAAFAAWRRRAGRADRARVVDASPATVLPEAPRLLAAPQAAEPLPAAPAETEPTAAAEPAERAATDQAEPPGAAPTPRFVSVPWTLTSGSDSSADTGKPATHELPIRFTLLGGRMELDRVDVRETDSQVFVTVLARYEPPAPGTPWVPYGVAGEATIRLDKPLGDRALIHAPDQLDELTHPGG